MLCVKPPTKYPPSSKSPSPLRYGPALGHLHVLCVALMCSHCVSLSGHAGAGSGTSHATYLSSLMSLYPTTAYWMRPFRRGYLHRMHHITRLMASYAPCSCANVNTCTTTAGRWHATSYAPGMHTSFYVNSQKCSMCLILARAGVLNMVICCMVVNCDLKQCYATHLPT